MRNSLVPRLADIIFKSVLAIIVISGIVITIALSHSAADAFNLFAYYTIQSNLIILGVILYGLFLRLSRRSEGKAGAIIRNGATLWILVTGLVYHFMLSGLIHYSGALWVYSLISLHYAVPLMVLLNWFVFEEKGKSSYLHVLYWLIYPALYVIFTQVRAVVDGFYPYWFLNPFKNYPDGIGSYPKMLLAVIILFAFFSLVGLCIIRIDRIWKKKN